MVPASRHVENNEKLLKKRQKKEYLYQVSDIDRLYNHFDKNDEHLDFLFAPEDPSDHENHLKGSILGRPEEYLHCGATSDPKNDKKVSSFKQIEDLGLVLSTPIWEDQQLVLPMFEQSDSNSKPELTNRREKQFPSKKRLNTGSSEASSVKLWSQERESGLEYEFEKVFLDDFDIKPASHCGFSDQMSIEPDDATDFVLSEDGLVYETERVGFL